MNGFERGGRIYCSSEEHPAPMGIGKIGKEYFFVQGHKIDFHSLVSYLGGQVDQIQKGGLRVFFQKIKKAFGFLSMRFFVPVVIHLKIDWPEGYYFAGNQLVKKYKALSVHYNGEKGVLPKVEETKERAISYFKKFTAQTPKLNNIRDWIDANMHIVYLSIGKNGYDATNYKKTAEVVQEVFKKHGLDQLDIEFIPRELAMGSIGVWENLDIYLKAEILGLRPAKKLILLVEPGTRVNNPCYLSYWSRYVTVISDPLLIQRLAPLERCLTVRIAFYMSFYNKAISSPFALGVVREAWNREKRRPLLEISDEDSRRGWESLKKLGVPRDAWFACLHVRESGWNDRGSSAENFRNADIHSYVPAIKTITDAGGWVVRMGDPSMTPLPPMERVIDYARSEAKSDWMDIFLCSQCRFIIGTSSGVYTICLAFGVPAVLTNLLPIANMYELSSRDMFIPRMCRSQTTNRYLTFRELASPSFGMGFSQHQYDSLDIEIIQNTPEEIRDVVTEMLGRLNGAFESSEQDDHLQDQFKILAAECGRLYGDEEIKVNACIGRHFLKKHAELLSMDRKEVSCAGT